MTGKINRSGLISDGFIINDDLIFISKRISDIHFKVTRVTFFTVGTAVMKLYGITICLKRLF